MKARNMSMLRKGDIVLVAVMILVVAAGYYIINLTRSSGDGAVAVLGVDHASVSWRWWQ